MPRDDGDAPARLDEIDRVARSVHRILLDRGEALPDDRSLDELVRAAAPLLPTAEVRHAAEVVSARVAGLGVLEPLVADPEVSEIMINGPGAVWAERGGTVAPSTIIVDRAAVDLLVERIVAPLGLRADRSAPIVDARLRDGSRVNVILPPLAIDGPCVTIRRFVAADVPLTAFCAAPVVELLEGAVRARSNLVVSGGTSSGKTTLLNAIARVLAPNERVITVEDAAELALPGDHVVRLEARPATADSLGAVTVRDLVRNALRMRPDRLVIGEVRAGEALDMLQAMNTGHAGSLSTCHANSPDDAMRRLETMALAGGIDLPLAAIREQLAAAVDLVVHVARDASGRRHIVEIAEVALDPAAPERTRRLATGDTVVAQAARTPRWQA